MPADAMNDAASLPSMDLLTVAKVPRDAPKSPPEHWIGNPPTHFRNPWPSFRTNISFTKVLQARFSKDRNFVPMPENREGLVPIQKPDWGAAASPQQIKATWIGHSSFLVEMPSTRQSRGLRFLMDPVFAKRMGPAQLVGPKRFSPTPCTLDELPLVDAICISHNHYDHLDICTVKHLYADKAQKRTAAGLPPLHIFCGLGSKKWFVHSCGIRPEHVTEMDWWDEVNVSSQDAAVSGTVRLVCTPSQHDSRRSPGDLNQMLWCSFVLLLAGPAPASVFFSGDTGYRSITVDDVAAKTPLADLPHCPAFSEIGEKYGPISLSLIPIGCYSPRTFMSGVHSAPEDAVSIHFDVKSQLSVGMHYGTVRGGISAHYEDVTEPPKMWRSEGEARGLVWDKDMRLCNIGETVVV